MKYLLGWQYRGQATPSAWLTTAHNTLMSQSYRSHPRNTTSVPHYGTLPSPPPRDLSRTPASPCFRRAVPELRRTSLDREGCFPSSRLPLCYLLECCGDCYVQ